MHAGHQLVCRAAVQRRDLGLAFERRIGGRVVVRSMPDHAVVWELGRRVAAVAERIRARLGSIGAADLVTQDVLIKVVGTLEKQQWLLRVQLGEKA